MPNNMDPGVVAKLKATYMVEIETAGINLDKASLSSSYDIGTHAADKAFDSMALVVENADYKDIAMAVALSHINNLCLHLHSVHITNLANSPEAVFWAGSEPQICQVSGAPLNGIMYDASLPLIGGCWANVCEDAFVALGGKLGTGLGQQYQQLPDGRWLKVAG